MGQTSMEVVGRWGNELDSWQEILETVKEDNGGRVVSVGQQRCKTWWRGSEG